MNIPETAIQAAAQALAHRAAGEHFTPDDPELDRQSWLPDARAALEAALPHIEAALRKQIANDIRADIAGKADYDHGLDDAARIAEEGTTK